MKFRWSIGSSQPLTAQPLIKQLGVSALLAQCLLQRGFSDSTAAAEFLDPKLKRLSDPFLLPNMEAAVQRLVRARESDEALVIFGDYDVDGVTSTALLTEFMRAMGWRVDYYLPHRLEEGYGLSADGVAHCLEKFPVTLLVAVDCGSTAVEPVQWLKDRGVDVVVLDHHQVSSPAPAVVALVNPQLSQSTPDFRELCSVGLAFKLAHAILKHGRAAGWAEAEACDLRLFLDLVALGTIADLVPLIGENRILAAIGLERLNQTRRPGLLALKEVAQINGIIGTYEVGFQLAPRLNAAGRLEDAEEALRLVLASSAAEATPVAEQLDTRNRERQEIERGISKEVTGAIRARFDPERDFVIVEGQMLWHIGVVGIVASRVLQEFYRPTIILGGEGDNWRGSGRSVEGFDLAAALRECDDLLVRHGGHAMAAGLTIHPDRLDQFRERLNGIARARLKPEQLKPALRIDAEATLMEVGIQCVEELDRLRPTGQANPVVQLVTRKLRIAAGRPPLRMGREQQHVKFRVTDGTTDCDVVWWNLGSSKLPDGLFDLAFVPQINEYNGRRSVQLRLLDWRPANL